MSSQSAAVLCRQPDALPLVKGVVSLGPYPKIAHRHIHKPAWSDQVPEILRTAAPGSLLPYGLGRSYGDSCLNGGRELIDCCRLNRFSGLTSLRAWCAAKVASASPTSLMYFFLRDGFFLLPPARSSSLLVGPLLMTFMVKTITALEPLALTSDKSDCIARTTDSYSAVLDTISICCAPRLAVSA